MPVLVVGTEKNFAALRPRLFTGRVSTRDARAVAEAIRAANPDVDLDRLTPGTVLTVPECVGARMGRELSLDQTSPRRSARSSTQARAALDELVTAARAASARSLRATLAGEGAWLEGGPGRDAPANPRSERTLRRYGRRSTTRRPERRAASRASSVRATSGSRK